MSMAFAVVILFLALNLGVDSIGRRRYGWLISRRLVRTRRA